MSLFLKITYQICLKSFSSRFRNIQISLAHYFGMLSPAILISIIFSVWGFVLMYPRPGEDLLQNRAIANILGVNISTERIYFANNGVNKFIHTYFNVLIFFSNRSGIIQDPNATNFKILSFGFGISYIVAIVIELVLGVKMYRFVDKNLMKTTERVQELQR